MSGEVSLDIVHEALQHVPQPMIGLDDDDLVVFVNLAAQAMFKGTKVVLGAEAVHLMPELLKQIHRVADGVKCTTDLGDVRFNVVARRMGNGTQSRGRLITFTKWEELSQDCLEPTVTPAQVKNT